MTPEEKIYYLERAAIERQRAAESSNPHVIEIHEKLAALYEKLVDADQFPVHETTSANAMSAPQA